MSCYTNHVIAEQDSGVICRYVADNYPGCGLCNDCSYRADYDQQKITDNYRKAQEWNNNNPNKYKCIWSNDQDYSGSFIIRSSSLEKAREIAQNSVVGWTTLLVK